jgi:hypothetical protein
MVGVPGPQLACGSKLAVPVATWLPRGSLTSLAPHRDHANACRISQVYEFFLNPPHTENYQMAWNPPNTDKLLSFLVKTHDFSQGRAEKAVQRLRASFGES